MTDREKRLESLLKEFIDEWEHRIAGCGIKDCLICISRYEYVNRVRKELGLEPVTRRVHND